MSFRHVLVPGLTVLLAAQLIASVTTANVVGTGTQNFNPTTDGLDYVTVHSSKTLKPGIFNLGGFLNYAVDSLPYVDNGVQSQNRLNDSLSSSDLSIGVGLLPNLSVGMSVPTMFRQTVEQRTGVRGDFSASGVTEMRFNTKYRFTGEDDGGIAMVASLNLLQTKNDPYAGAGGGPTYNLEFVFDRAINRKFTTAFNIGHRWRSPGTPIGGSLIEPMRNQLIASMAASYLIESTDTKVIAEIFGGVPAQSQGTNPTRNMTSAELLLGVKQDLNQKLALHVGGGTEIIQGVSSPDWRAYAGLNYTFGPAWGKEATQVRPVTVAAVVESVVESVESEVAPAVPAGVTEKFSVGSILFKFDSAEMVDDYPTILAGLVAELKRVSFKGLLIEGHTDSQGRVAYNNDLSLRRANAIRDYLMKSEKIDGNKIQVAGLGPSRPIANNGNYQGRQANRRVEFTITR